MHRWSHLAVAAAALAAGGLGQAQAPGSLPQESRQEYWAQIDRKDWGAASAAAQQLVAAAREQATQQPLKLAAALALLGDAQLGGADYLAAETAFAEALAVIEQHAGTASPKLVEPLRGLAYALAGSGRHEEAVPPLDRALLIVRRSYGLFDARQQSILRQLTASLSRSGRAAEAERHVNYLLQIAERTYGPRAPRQVPVLCFVGDWYASIGNFPNARATYRHAADIVESKLGNDPAAVQPLRSLARSYILELEFTIRGIKTVGRERLPSDADGTNNELKPINPRYLGTEGEKALERAVQILGSHAAGRAEALIATLVQLGDWHQVRHQPDKALGAYRRAAAASTQAMAAAADAHAAALAFPVRVYYPAPVQTTRYAALPADQVDETFVEVQFTVTRKGDVQDAKVTDRSGSARQAAQALQAIRAARYRPKFVDGEPVDTAGVTSREIFRKRKRAPSQTSEINLKHRAPVTCVAALRGKASNVSAVAAKLRGAMNTEKARAA